MNEPDYIENRLEDQINWYSKKSTECQKKYKKLRIIEIAAAACIPFIAGMGDSIPKDQWVLGILGIVVAITAGLLSLLKHHELWITYRTTCEQLKHEKYLYLTKSPPYDSSGNLTDLVTRVESLISKENSNWTTLSKNKPENAEE